MSPVFRRVCAGLTMIGVIVFSAVDVAARGGRGGGGRGGGGRGGGERPAEFWPEAGINSSSLMIERRLRQKDWPTKEKLDDLLIPANMTDPRQLPG